MIEKKQLWVVRVNRRLGSPEKGEGEGLMEMLSVEVDAGGDEEEENMMMADISFNSAEKSFYLKIQLNQVEQIEA